VTGYGPNDVNDTYKIRLMRVADPAKLSDPTQLTAGASHAAALEFYVEGVTGTNDGVSSIGVQAAGTDGEVFSALFTGAIDTSVYLSSSAVSLQPGEHGIFWAEVDLPAGVHVKAVHYLDETVYMPPDTQPVTCTVR
jgi:hypothetical protein